MQDGTPSYKRENLVNKHRFLKGDLEVSRDAAGYINRATVEDNSVLAHLVASRILNYSHMSAAATYSLWQHAFAKPFFAEPRKVYLIELLGTAGAGSNDEAAYRKLLRKLNRLDQHLVEKAITTGYAEGDGTQALANHYALAFDLLIKAIGEVEDELAKLDGGTEKLVAPSCDPR